jgi:hypothetical protein
VTPFASLGDYILAWWKTNYDRCKTTERRRCHLGICRPDFEDYERHRDYIRMNPVWAGLAARAEAYPYSSAVGVMRLDAGPQGLKPCALEEALTRT